MPGSQFFCAPARPLRGRWARLPAGAAAAGVNLGRPSRGQVRVLTGGRFARQKPPSNSTSAPTTATATAQPAASRRRLRHAQAHKIHSSEYDRKPSAHGRDASSMRTMASKRQSSLELTDAVSRLLDGIHLGEVDLDEVVRGEVELAASPQNEPRTMRAERRAA